MISSLIVDDIESRSLQSAADLLYVFVVPCFKHYPQIAAVHRRALICTLMVDRDDVSAKLSYDPGNVPELTGLVDELDVHGVVPSGHEKSTLDDS